MQRPDARTWVGIGALVLGPVAIGGVLCNVFDVRKGLARDEFSRRYSCPGSRIDIRTRSDIKPSYWDRLKPRPTPPPDVAADPDRLAVWNAKIDEPMNWTDDYYKVLEVHGCNQSLLVYCGGRGKNLGCHDMAYPPGRAPSW